jgi:NAD(P)-dependent dehydrogenase (short-subunit alcohol dehydrogenase family)
MPETSGRLSGKVAVVTGAGSGIGLATVRRFAAEGARVVCADLDEASGSAAAAAIDGTFIAVDVTSEDAVRSLFASTVDKFGSLDVAFNNAGISPPDDDSIMTTGLDA